MAKERKELKFEERKQTWYIYDPRKNADIK